MQIFRIFCAVSGIISLLLGCTLWWQLSALPATPLHPAACYGLFLLCFVGAVILMAWLLGIWGNLHSHQE